MITNQDRQLIKEMYNLTEAEIFESIKLHKRSCFSLCAAAKIVVGRRQSGFNDVSIDNE